MSAWAKVRLFPIDLERVLYEIKKPDAVDHVIEQKVGIPPGFSDPAEALLRTPTTTEALAQLYSQINQCT